MPHKKCPGCETEVGVRTLKCGCGHEFHPGKTKDAPEVSEAVKAVVANPPVVVKPSKDAVAELKKEAAELGFTIKELSKTGPLQKRFYIKKTIHNTRYIGVFNENGKITGIYEA